MVIIAMMENKTGTFLDYYTEVEKLYDMKRELNDAEAEKEEIVNGMKEAFCVQCSKKDFEAANCVRTIMGDINENYQSVVEFTCNLDDSSAERIGFAIEQLFEAGAVEAYTIPVTMKKSRPGNLLCVMCLEEKKQKVLEAIFKHTTTLGVRINISQRYALDRTIETVETNFGSVRVKKAKGFGVERQKYEYEDLAKIARDTGKSIEEVISLLSK